MGIPGAAVFYVRRDAMPALVPDRAGQESVCTSLMDRPALVWKEDAMRYQVGGDCTTAQVVLEQSLGLLVEAGVERIHPHVVALLDRLIAGRRRLGFTVTSSLGPQTRSAILSFTTGDLKRDEALRAHLLQRDVITALRPYGIRVSPHLYNAPEDIDALIEALQAA
ncbi:MAG: hypothetical protein QN168_02450 [Armatimonadota bacterium]|nr:hypothetical protein [Armatimonadota bacterium]